MKILISSYACSPYKGSEPGVGWGFVSALSKYHDLWVIVEEEKFREDIERYVEDNPEIAQTVRFIFLRKQRNRPLRKIWPPSYYWYYRRWQCDAFLLAQQLHKKIGFDLVHQLTMVGFREPGYLWKLGIPFVWGPVGGMGYFPHRFLPVVGLKGAAYYVGYNSMNFLHSKFLQRPKKAAEIAGKGLITATPENQIGALKNWGCSSRVIPEVGLPCTVSKDFSRCATGKPLKIVWTGQHTPGKALNLALKGMRYIDRLIKWELHVLGEGEKTKKLIHYVQKHGMADHCHFHGRLPRQEALGIMQASHVLLITSLRDLTSTVTIEGLALGLPIICLDHCGFTHVVTPECGIKIPVTSPRQVAEDIADGITKMWVHESWRQELAVGALRRAHAFSWEKKVSQVNEIYHDVLSSP